MMRRACRAVMIAIIGLAGRAHGFAAEPLPERTSYSGGMLGDETELLNAIDYLSNFCAVINRLVHTRASRAASSDHTPSAST